MYVLNKSWILFIDITQVRYQHASHEQIVQHKNRDTMHHTYDSICTMNDVSESHSKDKPPASLALDKLGIQHRVFLHEGHVTSFEQAASERGQRPAQVVR